MGTPGGRVRPSLCGAAVCIAGYLPGFDGRTHAASGLPLANGTRRTEDVTCPLCLDVARRLQESSVASHHSAGAVQGESPNGAFGHGGPGSPEPKGS